MSHTVAYVLAQALISANNLRKTPTPRNNALAVRHDAHARKIVERYLQPYNGAAIDVRLDERTNTIRYEVRLHQFDDYGAYLFTSKHPVTVKPDWMGVQLVIGGRDHRGSKDALADIIHHQMGGDIADADRFVDCTGL